LDFDKRALLESRLRKCIMELGVTPSEYVKLVKNQPDEQKKFITALTTHKTDWFRENIHFEILKKEINNEKNKRSKEWLIWSAACSSGEEVYSLLMTFLENNENRVKILGTDISENCLHLGQQGVYSPSQIHSQVPADLIQKYFLSGLVQGEKKYKFNPDFSHHLKWRNFNLVNSDLATPLQFDVIFLRNVLIYFDPEDATLVAERLCRYLKKGGLFVVGLSETIYKAEQIGLKRIENSVYRKL